MAKELTVVLKTPQPPAKSAGSKLLDALNGIVKSPVFVFVFGASFSAFLPALQNLAISDQELAARKAAEEARTDAVLVAPFIANLDASQPGKFEAAKAALRALAEAAGAADPTRERVMFTAVTRAIDATAVQIKPPTDKQLLTAEVVRQIDSQAQKAPAPPPSVPLNFDALKDAVVYVQVDQGKPEQAEAASEVVKSLKTNDVIAPGVERLPVEKMPENTQVRYFHEADKPRAEALAAIVGKEAKSEVYTAKLDLKAKPGTLELWYGKQ